MVANNQGDSTQLTGPAIASIKATVSLSATGVAGQKSNLVFVPDPSQPTITESFFQPPISEGNFVYKLYATTSPGVDGFVTARKNAVDLPIYFGPLSQSVPGTNVHIQKFSNHTIFLAPLDKLYLYFIQDVATTAVSTQSVQVGYVRVPVGYKKQVTIQDF